MNTRFQLSGWIIAVCLLLPSSVVAQDDERSLGDLARSLRQGKPHPPQDAPVIDNDNLAQATEDAKNRRPVAPDKDELVLSIDPAGNLKASSADVTCSMSFNARAGALLVKPVLMETLPLPELVKIDGPGSIQDESLQLEVFNGTDWELREITVGLTLERKSGDRAEMAARARVIPAAENSFAPTIEKRSDVTLLYHLKATAKPFSTTTFTEDIGIRPGPDEDWRWSIVEAKGIRPPELPSASDWLGSLPAMDLPSPLAPSATPSSAPGQGLSAHPADIAPPSRPQ